MTRAGYIAAIVLLSACRTAAPTTEKPVSKSAPPSAALLGDLAELATGASPTSAELERHLSAMRQGVETIPQFVDGLVHDPRFASEIAPSLVLQSSRGAEGIALLPIGILKQRVTPEGPIFYLREPCEPRDAEEVAPWWDLAHKIRVCPDSHRPKVEGDGKGWFCGAVNLDPKGSKVCGCGPNLVHCYRDAALHQAVVRSLISEVPDTVRYVVEHDLPVQAIFTANESYRDGLADFVYNRWRLLAGEIDALPDPNRWPDARWAKRPESISGQHAGILTTPQYLYMADAPRPRLAIYFSRLWCNTSEPQDVRTEVVLGLNAADTRNGEGWQQLASMKFCTNCHARMDYGVRFFSGWADARKSMRFFTSSQDKGVGPIYDATIDDLRGTAPLNPHGFAAVAVAQPEFGRCRTDDLVRHVFNNRASDGDRAAIMDAFSRTSTLRAMMKTALLRYAERYTVLHERADAETVKAATATTPRPNASAAPEQVEVPARLRAVLSERCVACHDEGQWDFSGATLKSETLQAMLSQISLGRMPKGKQAFSLDQRRALQKEIIDVVWPDAAERTAAFAYYTGNTVASPVHTVEAVLGAVGARAGADSNIKWNFTEKYITQDRAQYTPGFAAGLALDALAACKRAQPGGSADVLRACMKRASDLRGILKAPEEAVIGGSSGAP